MSNPEKASPFSSTNLMFKEFIKRKSEFESSSILPSPNVKLNPVFLLELSNSRSSSVLPEAELSLMLLLSELEVNHIPLPLLSLNDDFVMLLYFVETNLMPPSLSSTELLWTWVKLAKRNSNP